MAFALPYTFLGSFLTCVFLLQWWTHASFALEVWLSLGLLATLGIVMLFMCRSRPSGTLLLAAICGISLGVGSVQRHFSAIEHQTITPFASGSVVTIRGIVTAQPDDRLSKINYTVSVQNITTGSGATYTVRGSVLATDRAMRVLAAPGDEVEIRGKLSIPQESDDFSYLLYLQKDGITAVQDIRSIKILSSNNGYTLTRMLWRFRLLFEDRIAAVFPEPSASLLAGLLTGTRKGLPANVTEDFRRTGLSHIVAISGSNITIILSVITGMLFFLPRRWRLAPSIIAITIFTLFVGASASVVRAAITGILGLIVLHAERLPHTRLTILWTACVMLLWNPLQLWVDMGFQLSFLAVIGLAELGPLLKPLLKRVPNVLGVRETLQATLAAQLTAMPWAAEKFGLLSLIAPLANILLPPLVPIAMLFGFLATLAGWVWVPLGWVVGLPGLLALETTLWGAHILSITPYAAVTMPALGPICVTGYYAMLIIALLWLQKKTSRQNPPINISD